MDSSLFPSILTPNRRSLFHSPNPKMMNKYFHRFGFLIVFHRWPFLSGLNPKRPPESSSPNASSLLQLKDAIAQSISSTTSSSSLRLSLNRNNELFASSPHGSLLARVKQTTRIVGLDVVPNARQVLIELYNKTLKEVEAIPTDEGYRKAMEHFTRQRLKVCEEEEDWEVIEKRLACGQVEELIEEARDELTLIGKMIGL
ncbi:hypothetical protein F8388_002285 [Cannabis sativa]|uniref:Uncharacterized protein n=1 Tax=Cannabis sativa TaxID=3483 RepID=A0A7J6H237_CANSA|nr:hypothetical protein F8388_002285 [Cannabis sativa]KAF4389257.1 hypothetical protein G4B88_003070 [Cannabis sativa]